VGTLIDTSWDSADSACPGFLPPSPTTSCPAIWWGLSSFPGSPSRGVRWRRPIQPTVWPPWRSTVGATLPETSSEKEEEIDGALASLLSASWPTPAVVDDSFRRFPWDLGGSLVEQRYSALEGRRMVSLWTTIRANYGPLYAVPEETATGFPFLRRKEDWQVCRVLRHLAERDLPPEVGDKPYFSWDYYPGTPPKMGEKGRGYFVPGALGEWKIRTTLGVLVLHEQRELREVPVPRRKALYPVAPLWWASVEVPRGMAARMPQMVSLRGSKLMGETLGGPYHIMLSTLWAVEVADVFVGSIHHHGHLRRLPKVLRTALAELTAERLCSADSSVRPLLEAGLELLRLVEELGKESWLLSNGSPRGVFRCAKMLDDDGVLVLMEGLGDVTIPYGRDVTDEVRHRPLDRDLALAGPNRYGPAALLAPPASLPPSPPASSAGASSSAPPLWGAVSRPYIPPGGGRYGRARRTHPGGGLVPLIGGRSGPPLASLPLFSWDGAAQLGTPQPVRRAVWAGLARSLGKLPPILTNGVDHTLMMALSRTLVRLRNEMATIVSRPMGDRKAAVLYSLSTVDSIRRLLAEEYGTAVAETNTVFGGVVHPQLGVTPGPDRGRYLVGDAPASAVSVPTPLWSGVRLLCSAPLWGGLGFCCPVPLWGGLGFCCPVPLWGGLGFCFPVPVWGGL